MEHQNFFHFTSLTFYFLLHVKRMGLHIFLPFQLKGGQKPSMTLKVHYIVFTWLGWPQWVSFKNKRHQKVPKELILAGVLNPSRQKSLRWKIPPSKSLHRKIPPAKFLRRQQENTSQQNISKQNTYQKNTSKNKKNLLMNFKWFLLIYI